MIAALAAMLAQIDPSSTGGSMLSVAPSPGELFQFVHDSLPLAGTIVDGGSDVPNIIDIQSYWVPEPGLLAEDAFEVVASQPPSATVLPASDGFPVIVRIIAAALGAWTVPILICAALVMWQERRARAATTDAVWRAEHRERLQWVRSMIIAGQPVRALHELEHALEDL